MTREEIFDGLKEVIGTVKPKLDINSVSESSKLTSDLGIDSLSMLLVSLAIETKFGFQFASQKPFETVGEVIDYIESAI